MIDSGASLSAIGRFEAVWESDLQGLAAFWKAVSARARIPVLFRSGITAEQEACWQLAADMQSECLALLASTTRIRHKALAHLPSRDRSHKSGQVPQLAMNWPSPRGRRRSESKSSHRAHSLAW